MDESKCSVRILRFCHAFFGDDFRRKHHVNVSDAADDAEEGNDNQVVLVEAMVEAMVRHTSSLVGIQPLS